MPARTPPDENELIAPEVPPEGVAASTALWEIPEGVVPSVTHTNYHTCHVKGKIHKPRNEAPHSDCTAGDASETRLGMSVVRMLYAALIQFVQVILLGILGTEPPTAPIMFAVLRGPKTLSKLVRV